MNNISCSFKPGQVRGMSVHFKKVSSHTQYLIHLKYERFPFHRTVSKNCTFVALDLRPASIANMHTKV